MNVTFELTPLATEDLDSALVVCHSQRQSQRGRSGGSRNRSYLPKRVASHPLMEWTRTGLRYIAASLYDSGPVTRYPNYVIVYRPETVPLHGTVNGTAFHCNCILWAT